MTDRRGDDIDDMGGSFGKPVAGMRDDTSYSPTGAPGQRHWGEATISRPGLDDRSGIYFAAVEMTRMPMILTDPNLPDNPVVFANRAFEDLTGYDEDEVVGRNCRFLQGALTDRERVAELRAGIAERRPVSVEVLNYKRDGTPFWNGVYVAPVFAEDGSLLYFFASQLDVTRRRTSEQAYRQAQKMEAIGQLTAGLAHDFNNLLQVVSGNLELLSGRIDEGDARARRYVDNARAAAERGARITRQLLAFARKTRLESRPVDMAAIVPEFSEMLASSVNGEANLRVEIPEGLPLALLDPTHLEMALLNVVINARDAMPGGGVVRVSASAMRIEGEEGTRRLPDGDYLALDVTDSGEGMPPHVLERAIEPFFTTKETGKGTGLGLAMVHGFVQQSRGRLDIESVPGSGTTVRMLFPVARPEEVRSTAPAEVAHDLPMAANHETILVVDDDANVLELASEHLSGLGYDVVTARSAEEALPILASRDLDLLFTDLIMPGGMNGLGLAERAASERPDMPVLLTTGYNEDLVADGPRTTLMDVLGKPYTRTELADRVRAALSRGPGRAAPRVVAHVGPAHEG